MTRSKARRQLTNQSPVISDTDDGDRSLHETPGGPNSADTDGAGEVEVDQFEIIPSSNKELGTKTAIFLLLLIFLSSALAMFLVLKTFPDLNDEDKQSLKFPHDIDDAKELGQVLSRYKDQYFPQVWEVFRFFILIFIGIFCRYWEGSSVFTSSSRLSPYQAPYFSP